MEDPCFWEKRTLKPRFGDFYGFPIATFDYRKVITWSEGFQETSFDAVYAAVAAIIHLRPNATTVTGVGAIKQGQHQWFQNDCYNVFGVETAAVIQIDA